MLNKHDIDLKKEFSVLQNQFGIDILYMRANKYIRCKCYDVLHQCGDPKCKICLGMGHVTSIEKAKVVQENKSISSERDIILPTPTGVTHISSLIVYTSESLLSKERDYIFITSWDTNGAPVEILKVYEVVNVQSTRDTKGKTAFCSNYIKLKAEMTIEANKYIKALPSGAKLSLSRGRRYAWPITV